MHRILEIALGVGLGMTIFLVILWILGTCVYICCGKTKKIATVRKLKTYQGIKEAPIVETNEAPIVETNEAPIVETNEAPIVETNENV
jgi:hypothetical protein